MTYEKIVDIIQGKRRFESKSGYEVSRELLGVLGTPEAGMKTIHIAGTNGKGSTAAYLNEILMAAGFCVGLFTSPHLVTFRERIRVNGEMISKADVVRLGERVLSEEAALPFSATMFDMALGMAILYFAERGCDYVILETGLGGAKDSTRALSVVPEVSVITRIGYDHEAVLGGTLSAIAAEKAGILRSGTKAVIAEMDKEAFSVIAGRCGELAIPYVRASEAELQAGMEDLPQAGAPPGLFAHGYQRENMKNAACAARLLLESGTGDKAKIEMERTIAAGLQNAYWPGRLDVISKNPFILLDGAHNPQGVQALKDSLSELYPGEKFLFLVGILADKDYAGMLGVMLPLASHFYAVTVDSDRAMQGKEIAAYLNDVAGEKFEGNGIAEPVEGIPEAFSLAISQQRKTGEKIVVFGSLYFIGDVMEWKEKGGRDE